MKNEVFKLETIAFETINDHIIIRCFMLPISDIDFKSFTFSLRRLEPPGTNMVDAPVHCGAFINDHTYKLKHLFAVLS